MFLFLSVISAQSPGCQLVFVTFWPNANSKAWHKLWHLTHVFWTNVGCILLPMYMQEEVYYVAGMCSDGVVPGIAELASSTV